MPRWPCEVRRKPPYWRALGLCVREGYYVLYSVDLDRVSTLSEVVLLFLAEPPRDGA
jgi:hypothetical protein